MQISVIAGPLDLHQMLQFKNSVKSFHTRLRFDECHKEENLRNPSISTKSSRRLLQEIV